MYHQQPRIVKSKWTMGQVIRQFSGAFIKKYKPNYRVRTILEHIANCKTAALGGHKTVCTVCDQTIYSYNSCGDRNCPQCQTIKKQLWVDKMNEHLLPIKHFHVIFTLPQELNDLIYANQKELYSLFFRAVWQTVKQITNPNSSGMVAVLHTWGSNMSFHPHIHCIIPSGAWTGTNWINHKGQGSRFYCRVKKLTKTYKACYIKLLDPFLQSDSIHWPNDETQTLELVKKGFQKKWTVRVETPVLGTQQIVEYLSRYVYRTAITNSRIESINENAVVINYKDYANQEKGKPAPKALMQFGGAAFIQRFVQHLLPVRFQRIRYYGCYAWCNKALLSTIYKQITKRV